MSRTTTGTVTTLIAAAGLLLTACGGGGAAGDSAAGGGDSKPIKVTSTDDKCEVATHKATTGPITFAVTNKGSKVTEFYLYTSDGQIVSEVENISPGLTRKMTAQVTEPGAYVTACKPGMQGKGIRGKFTVTGKKQSAALPQGVVTQYSVLQQEIASAGGKKESGAWRIGYIVEAAEAWYTQDGNGYRYRKPAPDETHHIEIIPIEKSTGRIVPDVPIKLEVIDSAGNVVDSKKLNFYYSTFFHYANNFSVPKAGTYTLKATLQAPTFNRHGKRSEKPALARGTEVSFDKVKLTPQG